ncbi:MAG: ribokinase [Telmatospirillum sp.]|nr:ribokinase [Telmatospirillum sp.]
MTTSCPLVVFGSVNVDIVCAVDHLPKPGETIHTPGTTTGLGGKGANQAASIARLGAPVVLAGRTGADPFGAIARDRLASFGVDLSHLATDPDRATGVAMINVDLAGQNTITVAGGANLAVRPEDADAVAGLLRRTPVALFQLEIPIAATLAAAGIARTGGAVVILDPAPAPKGGLDDSVFRAVDIMTPNETETMALVGILPHSREDAAAAAERFLSRGLASVVVKLGANGVYFRGPAGDGYVEPFPVTTIDSVAAGDCFNGGLAVALSRGDDLPSAVRFAAACGALATTRRGASDAAPSLAEVGALLSRPNRQ